MFQLPGGRPGWQRQAESESPGLGKWFGGSENPVQLGLFQLGAQITTGSAALTTRSSSSPLRLRCWNLNKKLCKRLPREAQSPRYLTGSAQGAAGK